MINKHIKYQKVLNTFALLLIMVYSIQIASYALFFHTHQINGKSYSHAHPGCDGHSHSGAELTFYQQLQTIKAEDSPHLLSDVVPLAVDSTLAETYARYHFFHTRSNAGRAPPLA